MGRTILVLFGLALVITAGNSHADVQTGRQLLFNNGGPTSLGALAAKAEFEASVNANPNDQEASFFLAVSRILALLHQDAAYLAGPPIENTRELLDGFGFSPSGRDLFSWTADFTRGADGKIVLPTNPPAGHHIQQYLRTVVIPEIDAALANLSGLNSAFGTLLLATETGTDETIEVDYGDVLVYRALLYAAKSTLLFLCSYDLDADPHRVVEVIDRKLSNFNSSLLDLYATIFELLPGGGDSMSGAKQAAIAAVDQYTAASGFIRAEIDYQGNDLVSIDPEEVQEEAYFRALLTESMESLLQERFATLENKVKTKAHHVNYNRFFGTGNISPVYPRPLIPYFDADGNIPAGTFPDPTLGGILIDSVTEAKFVDAFPADLPVVFPIPEGTMTMDGSESDWQNIAAIPPAYFQSNGYSTDIQYLKVARDSSYLFWMIKFITPVQTGRYYSLGVSSRSAQGYSYASAAIQENGTYSIWSYPPQVNNPGTLADFKIGTIIEGRIPIGFINLSNGLGLSAYASKWSTGYYTSLYDSKILSNTPPPIALAGPDLVVDDSVSLNGKAIYPNKFITSWEWFLNHRTSGAYSRTATGPTPTVTNLATGIYDVVLKTTDDSGKTYSDSMILVATGQTGGGYTQADMDQAVELERQKWDAGGDAMIGLAEAIRALQITSGLREE